MSSNTTTLHATPKGFAAYIKVIADHSKFIVLLTVASALLTAAIMMTIPNRYTAVALILPAQEERGLSSALMAQFGGLLSMSGTATPGTPTAGDLYITMLTSEPVMTPVIERVKLMETYAARSRTDARRMLASASSITLGRKDGVITVAVTDRNPTRAAEVANAYVDELGKLTIKLNIAGAGKARSYLETRLSEARTGLVQAEDALKTFQSRNKTIQVPQQAEATIRGIAEMKAALVLKEVELATVRRSLTDTNNEVKDLKSSIGNLKAQIQAYEGGMGGGAIPALGTVPELGQEYGRLMREFKVQEAMVELLTKQYEMTKLTEAKDYSPFQVLQPASVPEKKSRPQRLKVVLLVTVTTFLVTLFAVFLKDFWDRMSEDDKRGWLDIGKIFARQLTFSRKRQ